MENIDNSHRLLILTGIFPPDIGGPATMLGHLCSALVRQGFKIKVVAYSNQSGREPGDFEVKRVKKKSQLRYFWSALKLARQADVIYTTDTYSAGFFAYLLKKLFSKPYILRFTGDSAWEISRTKGWVQDNIVNFQDCVYSRQIERLKRRRNKILFNADGIIVDSDFNRRLAEKIGAADKKIVTIYNSVDFKDSDISQSEVSNLRQQYGQGAKILLTSCRLTPWKGVAEIIKVLPKLIQQVGPVNFLILGEGEEMSNLQKMGKELGLAKNLYFLGKIKHSEIAPYFKAADAFVLNSQYEGLSHAILDAMQAGVPVVASRMGGNAELITAGQEGLLFDYQQPAKLLDALVRILSDEILSKKFTQAAKVKLAKFSWERAVSQTIAVLNSL